LSRFCNVLDSDKIAQSARRKNQGFLNKNRNLQASRFVYGVKILETFRKTSQNFLKGSYYTQGLIYVAAVASKTIIFIVFE
jgi:hypothetical protein